MNVVNLIVAMSIVLGCWLVLGLALVGVGLIAVRLLVGRRISGDTLTAAFWLGFCVVIIFLQIWNLFLPVDWRALYVVLGCGAAGLVWNFRDIKNWLAGGAAGRNKLTIFLAAACAIWTANVVIGPCLLVDTGVYHAMGVRWASEYAIVPGLGNLYGNLAFNNSGFLFAAMMEAGPMYGRSVHLANGLLFAAMLIQCVRSAATFVRSSRQARPAIMFEIVLLCPLAMMVGRDWIASFSTDMPAIIAIFAATSAMFRFLLADHADLAARRLWLVVTMLMMAVAVCLKMSVGVYGGVACLIVLVSWWRGALSLPGRFATAAWAILLASAAIVPWLIRGVILSGYLLFPSSAISFGLDWQIPEKHCFAYQTWFKFFSRKSLELEFSGWIGPWINSLDKEIVTGFFLIVGLAAIWLILRRRFANVAPAMRRGTLTLMLLPSIAAMVFWFVTAPQSRFGFFMFWTLAAALIAAFVDRFSAPLESALARKTSPDRCGRIVAAAFLAAVVVLAVTGLKFKKTFCSAGPDGGFHPLPVMPMRIVENQHGFKCYQTTRLDPADQSWDAPLPCTSYVTDNIRMRRPGDIQSGFQTVGPGEYQRFWWAPDAEFQYPSMGPLPRRP